MSKINPDNDISRMQSALTYPIAWAVERFSDMLPDWNGYGVLPELYEAMKGGVNEAANFTRHRHGINMLDLPHHCFGFQNAYSVLNLADGILKTKEVYTFRRNDNGLETPIDYKSPERQPTTGQLQFLGEQSIDKEIAVGGQLVKSILGPEGRRGDFMRAKCLAELTDGDAQKAPDPTGYEPLFSRHEAWMIGQIGKRSIVATTPHGAVYKYEAPSKLQKLETYVRTDLRYSIRNAPIELMGLENLPVFKGPPLQRMLTGLTKGCLDAEQDDYAPGYTPDHLPLRADGVINPLARHLPTYR